MNTVTSKWGKYGAIHARLPVFCVLALLSLLSHWLLAEGGDKDWLLLTAQMWLSGKELYHDLMQPNMPFITWYYAALVWLAPYVGLKPAHLLVLVSYVVIFFSLYVCASLMKSHPLLGKQKDKYRLHTQFLFLLFTFFQDSRFFGDRDSLIVILLFPHFIRFMPSVASNYLPRRWVWASSLMAGIALCVKPQAAVMVGAPFLLEAIRRRSIGILLGLESGIIVTIQIIYLALILRFTTDYFTVLLPMLLATYSAVTRGLERIMYYSTSLFLLGVTLADFRWKDNSPYRRDILYLLGLVGSAAGYSLIGNGWFYTFYAFNALTLLLALWIYWEFVWLAGQNAGNKDKRFTFGIVGCWINLISNTLIMIFTFCAIIEFNVSDRRDASLYLSDGLAEVVRKTHAKTIGALSPDFGFWVDLVRKTGVTMETRFNHLFMVPKFLVSDEAFSQKYAWIPEYTANALAEDISSRKPDLVFVSTAKVFAMTGHHIDIIKYYSSYPSFATAWKAYRLLDEEQKDYCAWAVAAKLPCDVEIYQRNAEQ